MKVYVCYDRYENDEWFNVYSIGTDRDVSIEKCKKEDLPDFISYGPDDCHSFQLVEVELTQEEYEQLLEWDKDDSMSLEDSDSPYYQFMCDLYDDQYETETIISTDGQSDVYEIVQFFMDCYELENYLSDIPDDEDKLKYEVQELLFSNDELFDKVMREYIEGTY